MTYKHHIGKCVGGPYHGQVWDYFECKMTVLSFPTYPNSGHYVFTSCREGCEEGTWHWVPLVRQ